MLFINEDAMLVKKHLMLTSLAAVSIALSGCSDPEAVADSVREHRTILDVIPEGFELRDPSGKYDDLSTDWLVGTGRVKPERIAGINVKNAHEGLITAEPYGDDASRYLVTSTNIPSHVCEAILADLQGTSYSVGIGNSTDDAKAVGDAAGDPGACEASDRVTMNFVGL